MYSFLFSITWFSSPHNASEAIWIGVGTVGAETFRRSKNLFIRLFSPKAKPDLSPGAFDLLDNELNDKIFLNLFMNDSFF